MSTPSDVLPPPSAWVLRFAPLLPAGGSVLDLACGRGRHLRALRDRGLRLRGVDRDAQALEPLRAFADIDVADLEAGPWPYPDGRFDGVIVTNYLWRPLLPKIIDLLAPGGILIYETFALGNECLGSPRNPDFLLRPGELLDAVRPRLRVIAFEDGSIDLPRPAFVQRICAVRPRGDADGGEPAAYNL